MNTIKKIIYIVVSEFQLYTRINNKKINKLINIPNIILNIDMVAKYKIVSVSIINKIILYILKLNIKELRLVQLFELLRSLNIYSMIID